MVSGATQGEVEGIPGAPVICFHELERDMVQTMQGKQLCAPVGLN